ncbi:MAG: N-acetylmuramoyl-L-alanine amidase family protein [Bdellovibrionia bacterium]
MKKIHGLYLITLGMIQMIAPQRSLLWTPCWASPQPFQVVLDPGHGGSDEGTVYESGQFRVAEKTITLALAKRVEKLLKTRGYRVALTRSDDREVPLAARTQLANQLKARVFISIHLNSSDLLGSQDAEGVETYILNSTTDASSRRLSQLENSVISADPKNPTELDVALILKDLRLDANLGDSKRLACTLQNHLVSATSQTSSLNRKRRNRGVKQALFHVLLGADMPSVLVETGFLKNPYDRALFMSHSGQNRIAQAIVEAIESYQKQMKSGASKSAWTHCPQS